MPRQPQSGIHGNASFAVDDLIYSPWRDLQGPGQSVPGNSHRFHELFQKDFSGMDRRYSFSVHWNHPLVIINDFNFMGIVVFRPNKANTKLIVNPNTILPLSVVFESFESVGRRDLQIIQLCRSIEHPRLAESHRLDVMRQLSRKRTIEDLLRFLALEALYHTLMV